MFIWQLNSQFHCDDLHTYLAWITALNPTFIPTSQNKWRSHLQILRTDIKVRTLRRYQIKHLIRRLRNMSIDSTLDSTHTTKMLSRSHNIQFTPDPKIIPSTNNPMKIEEQHTVKSANERTPRKRENDIVPTREKTRRGTRHKKRGEKEAKASARKKKKARALQQRQRKRRRKKESRERREKNKERTGPRGLVTCNLRPLKTRWETARLLCPRNGDIGIQSRGRRGQERARRRHKDVEFRRIERCASVVVQTPGYESDCPVHAISRWATAEKSAKSQGESQGPRSAFGWGICAGEKEGTWVSGPQAVYFWYYLYWESFWVWWS